MPGAPRAFLVKELRCRGQVVVSPGPEASLLYAQQSQDEDPNLLIPVNVFSTRTLTLSLASMQPRCNGED